MAMKRPKAQSALGSTTARVTQSASTGSALARELNATYFDKGAQDYQTFGKNEPIPGYSATPFKRDLRQVKSVNLPYQVGQRSYDNLIESNKQLLGESVKYTSTVLNSPTLSRGTSLIAAALSEGPNGN